MEEKTQGSETEEKGGFVKSAIYFIGFFIVAFFYYWMINYVLMVFAQNLPFPYEG